MEVDQIKFYFLLMVEIRHLEVKPSCMSLCVAVNSHQQVVLDGTNKDRKVKITTFKVGVKPKIAFFDSWVHSRE